MRVPNFFLALLCAPLVPLAVPGAAVAQDEPTSLVYGTYMQCNPMAGQRLSEITRDVWAPIIQKHVDAGHLTAWGSLTHNTGGPWSRVVYTAGTDRAVLLETLQQVMGEWYETSPETMNEYFDACPTHEDYIWSYVTGSTPADRAGMDRASAGMSVYWVCEERRESAADEIVEQVFAPIYNAQVEAGLMNAWGWYSHFIGGKYRRLLSMDGPSHEALLQARDNIIEAMNSEVSGMSDAFADVCNGHTDYLWDISMTGQYEE